jgi:hypothetical protein
MADLLENWTWCPVMEAAVFEKGNRGGHSPASKALCNGTPHRRLLVGDVDCKVCKNTGLTYDETEHRMVPCGRIECAVPHEYAGYVYDGTVSDGTNGFYHSYRTPGGGWHGTREPLDLDG